MSKPTIYILIGIAVLAVIVVAVVMAHKPAPAVAPGGTAGGAVNTAAPNLQLYSGGGPQLTAATGTGTVGTLPGSGSAGTPASASLQSISDTGNNYLIWATGIIAYLTKYSINVAVCNALTDHLNAATSNYLGQGNWYGVQYTTDTDTVGSYNRNLPNLDVYTSQSAATAALGVPMLGANLAGLTSVTMITPQVAFHNCINVMATIAKNNVQANTQGQAIGSRQSIINTETANMNAQEGNMLTIPSQASECVLIYTYSLQPNDWPSGFGGGNPNNSQLAQIAGVVIAVAGVVLIATGVGAPLGAAVVGLGTAVSRMPG